MFLRFLTTLPLILISPVLALLPWLVLLATDGAFKLLGRRRPPSDHAPRTHAASVVIPNWNGRDLLDKYIPSVVAAMKGHPDNEIIVVDNASTDDSVALLAANFPQVRVIPLPRNLGFGGGSNTGFEHAKNDIVVLLNSDMQVEPDFLAPLLAGFNHPSVFAVSCQIFFPDAAKHREETGLTQGWWENGGLRVTHRNDPRIDRAFPCFYPGGGSGAYDRAKFLELGGFDHLFHPFYLEDTDIGMQAWKRGWRVFYEPRSRVWHQHRATIWKKFSRRFIDSTVQKNLLLFSWKNIHEPGRFTAHVFFNWAGALLSVAFGDSMERPGCLALWKAFLQLPWAAAARWRAHSLAEIPDTEALRRPMAGYFRDRFLIDPKQPLAAKPCVLFLSPYPICPPHHGGAVFMGQTCRELAKLVDLSLVVMVDQDEEIPPHAELAAACRSAHYYVRPHQTVHSFGTLDPHAVHEFRQRDAEWLIHREIYLREIDVVQYEYLQLAQYRGDYRNIAQFLFEHDVYSQSVGTILPQIRGLYARLAARYEYLRSLRYELLTLPLFDGVQYCSQVNAEFVYDHQPALLGTGRDDLRSGVTVSEYQPVFTGRKPFTLLFIGSFRHAPNKDALYWLVNKCMPLILAAEPRARLTVIGSDPPPRYSLPDLGDAIDLRGYVDDIMAPLAEHAVFVCPILSGSGIRVKLMESFACGIPVVSTRIGAEGLAEENGKFCRLTDTPEEFAKAVIDLFAQPEKATAMARRARREIELNWDMPTRTKKLVKAYRETLVTKRAQG